MEDYTAKETEDFYVIVKMPGTEYILTREQAVKLQDSLYEVILNTESVATNESSIPFTQCDECKAYGKKSGVYVHLTNCSRISKQELVRRIEFVDISRDKLTRMLHKAAQERSRWQAKFMQVKWENNQLRKKVSKQEAK